MTIIDSGRGLIELARSVGAAGGFMRFASIEAPSVRVIGCTVASAKIVEVDGKRYRAHPYTDDGVPCVAWDLSDEIKDGE